MELFKDIWGFMKTRKKFWLLPIIIFSLLLSGLAIVGSGSAISPFIYTVF